MLPGKSLDFGITNERAQKGEQEEPQKCVRHKVDCQKCCRWLQRTLCEDSVVNTWGSLRVSMGMPLVGTSVVLLARTVSLQQMWPSLRAVYFVTNPSGRRDCLLLLLVFECFLFPPLSLLIKEITVELQKPLQGKCKLEIK